jgi:hypothetical protein
MALAIDEVAVKQPAQDPSFERIAVVPMAESSPDIDERGTHGDCGGGARRVGRSAGAEPRTGVQLKQGQSKVRGWTHDRAREDVG